MDLSRETSFVLTPALQKAGFDGVISLEMGHGYKGPGEIVARKGYEFFQARYGIM